MSLSSHTKQPIHCVLASSGGDVSCISCGFLRSLRVVNFCTVRTSTLMRTMQSKLAPSVDPDCKRKQASELIVFDMESYYMLVQNICHSGQRSRMGDLTGVWSSAQDTYESKSTDCIASLSQPCLNAINEIPVAVAGRRRRQPECRRSWVDEATASLAVLELNTNSRGDASGTAVGTLGTASTAL